MNDSSPLYKKLESKRRTVKDLADYIKTRSGSVPNYSLFLGAGASVTSGIRTAVDLVDEWRKEIFIRLSSMEYSTAEHAKEWLANNHRDWYESSNEYSSLFEKKFDLPSQRRRFVELQVDRKLPSIGYAYLVELFEGKCFDTVFTTNFDDLINEAFYQFSSDRPLLCAHDSSIKGVSITSIRPKIIKLHGDYLFDSIKSSLNETESLEVNTKEKLIEFTKEYGLIFVGYAGNDNSIMDIIKYLLKQDDYLKNGVYWCKRKGDDISQELFKFLSRDKVYYVEIDGFDELMAELCHELGVNLSLGGSQKSTKRERMINNFIEDEYSLSKNSLINRDIASLKKHTYMQDISSLINELSDNEGISEKIPEIDFRKLLTLDNLIKNKVFDKAEDEIEKLLSLQPDDNMKAKFLQRLIEIHEEKNETEKALEQSDRLIRLDEYNISYCLSRTNLYKEIPDKVKYLKGLFDKFKYSIDIRNEASRFSIKYLEGNYNDNLVQYDDVLDWLNTSLAKDCSLENPAWRLKRDAIVSKYEGDIDKKERNEIIDTLLSEMKSINPTNTNYLGVLTSHISESQDHPKVRELISNLTGLFETTSRSKKKYLLRHLSVLHSCLLDSDEIDDSRKLMKKFIDDYSNEKKESQIAPFLIFKARYYIGLERNVELAINCAKAAMDAIWRNNEIEKICDLLLIDENNVDIVDEYLNALPNDVPETLVLKIRSDMMRIKGNYKESIELLDKAHNSGWDFSGYILSKTYLNLCAENYEKVIEISNESIDKVKSYREKDILIINREVAKKRLGYEIKDNEIRSILSHHQSKGEVAMCAYFLLDDDFNAKKQLKILIEKDFFNYYRFKDWPAVPSQALSQYSIEIKKVA
ncbi:SIR2 family protein [Serratia fonticola]|uniref:SIR2 family protein n=1 Tax=Serratia fonticola TaxID=47917 RepID=A0AAJ2D6H1_SERFO|nr:SIR2 family protein [Serratia fonticola]MDQ9126262.1 SIR2 family protein [Serratia fonticola]